MAITEKYANFDLTTGLNDGTSEANAWQAWANIVFAAGQRVNLKTPTRQVLGTSSQTVSSTELAPVILRGYTSTIGDGGKALLDMGTSSLTLSGEGCVYQNMDITGSSVSAVFILSGDMSRAYNIKVVNTGTSSNRHNAVSLSDSSLFNSYVETNGTSSGLATTNTVACVLSRGVMSDCVAVSTNTAINAGLSFRDSVISNVLCYEKGVSGGAAALVSDFTSSGSLFISGITTNGFSSGIEISSMEDLAAAYKGITINKAIIANSTTGISNVDTATYNATVQANDVAFYNNTTDSELGDFPIINTIALTADPFTDSANDDYSLNNTSGGGALCRAAGLFSAGVVTNYYDIGAMQIEAVSSSGGVGRLVGSGGLV